MTDFAVSHHEASHAVIARMLNLPLRHVSIRPDHDGLGRTSFDVKRWKKPDDFTAAIVCIAGTLGEQKALGHVQRVNWFVEDQDIENARVFIDACAKDPLEARRLAELRAKSGLLAKWDQVEAVAAKLDRSTTLLAEEVEQICKQVELRKKGWTDAEIRAKSRKLTKAEALAKMSPTGRRALMGKVGPDGKVIEKATKDRGE